MDRIRVLSLFFTIFIIASRSLGSPHRKISSVDSAIDKFDNSSGSGGSPSISPSGSVLNSGDSKQGSLNSNLNPPVVNEIHEKSPSPSPEDPAKSDANGTGSQGGEGGSKDQSHVGDRAPEPREKCNPSNLCTDHDKMIVACLQGSEKLLLVVYNEGNDTLKVNIKLPSVEFPVEELSKQQSKEFKLPDSVNAGGRVKVVLNAGHGDCILYIGPTVSPGNFFHNLPSYTSLMTPIYGACVLFLTAVIAGGAWACCKFGRKRRHSDGGVPYQELEMGVPESTTQDTAADITNGWDRSWDDDWEDELTRVPDKSTGNAKVNGLSSKAAKGEGWDDDWDD